ncbi:MAG: alpha/beta hydrolase [Candidatus Obscuribacterales bacterium]|nr:alpha/beta hydrolase [Candidatus Obscuribacterales bacterium]
MAGIRITRIGSVFAVASVVSCVALIFLGYVTSATSMSAPLVEFSQTLPGRPMVSHKGSKVTYNNINYGERGADPAHQLTLYTPANTTSPAPLIVWIHGGAWMSGRGIAPKWISSFVNEGFAVATVNYRLVQEARHPAQIEDISTAIRFLSDNAKQYKLDPNRIGVWGASAGGHLAALVGTAGNADSLLKDVATPLKIAAVVDWCGPSDLEKLGSTVSPKIQFDWISPMAPLSLFLGGPAQQNRSAARSASAITFVDREDPPFLIMHGVEDEVVPVEQSDLLADALVKAGVDVAYVKIPKAKHDFESKRTVELVRKFFRSRLNTD